MPDINLRFHKDMLVLSSPISSALVRQGIDVAHDTEFTIMFEPETIEDAYKLEHLAGAQCLVAATATLTPARLAHVGMESRAEELAASALGALAAFTPQHVLVEVGPCGLPLDASSKASLNENRDQYVRFARAFSGKEFDAFFLNGFKTCADLKCALMGLRKVSDKPVFASVDVMPDGLLASGRGTLEEAVAVMGEFGASVAGFSTAAGREAAVALARRVAAVTNLPILVQLEVRARDARAQGPTDSNPYYAADTMMPAAEALRGAGAQFLRAVGDATPAYTGALVATTVGLDVRVPEIADAGAGAADVADAPAAGAASAGAAAASANAAVAGTSVAAAGADATADAGAQVGAPSEELAALIERARARVEAAISE